MSRDQIRRGSHGGLNGHPSRKRNGVIWACIAGAVLVVPAGIAVFSHLSRSQSQFTAAQSKPLAVLGTAEAVELVAVPGQEPATVEPVIQIAANIVPPTPMLTTADDVPDMPGICLTAGELIPIQKVVEGSKSNTQPTAAPLLPDAIEVDAGFLPPGSLTPPPMPETRSLAFQDPEKPAPAKVPTLIEKLRSDSRSFQNIGQSTLDVKPPVAGLEQERLRKPSDPEVVEKRESKIKSRLGEIPTQYHVVGTKRGWEAQCVAWEPSGYHHGPLYFEDVQLERYGNEIPWIQPFLSAGAFYATIPTLPYQTHIEGNGVCAEIYDLGHDRPGDCVSYGVQRLPVSLTGALAEAAAAVGLVAIIP